MNVIKEMKAYNKKYNELHENNSEAINSHLQKVFQYISYVGCVVIFLTIVLQLVMTRFGNLNLLIYRLVVLGVVLGLLFLFHQPKMKAYILAGLYILVGIFLAYAITLSIRIDIEEQATAYLAISCVAPIFLVDKVKRLFLFILSFSALHIALIFVTKPSHLIYADTLNITIFTVVGLAFSHLFMRLLLVGFEAQRLLSIQSTTDSLTQISNRRRLYEELGAIEEGRNARPSVTWMIDIDFFKNYNDSYGHRAGDDCLRMIGKVMKRMEEKYMITFYRYGGEEFTAFMYDAEKKDVVELAKDLQKAVGEIPSSFEKITLSMGAVICEDERQNNYEKWIERADKALYQAKENGRNQLILL